MLSFIGAVLKEAFLYPYCFLISAIPSKKIYWPATSEEKECPILFVHGYLNSARVWKFHGKYLSEKGFGPIHTISLGSPFSSIESYAKKVRSKLQEIDSKKVIINPNIFNLQNFSPNT